MSYLFFYTIIYTSCHTVSPVVPECWLEGRKRVNIKITLQTPQILLRTVAGYTCMVSRISSLPSLASGRPAACPPLPTFQTFNYSPKPRALLQSNVSSRKILFPIARAAAVYCAHSGVNNSSSLRRGGGGFEASYCPSAWIESTSRAPRHVSKDFLPSLVI